MAFGHRIWRRVSHGVTAADVVRDRLERSADDGHVRGLERKTASPVCEMPQRFRVSIERKWIHQRNRIDHDVGGKHLVECLIERQLARVVTAVAQDDERLALEAPMPDFLDGFGERIVKGRSTSRGQRCGQDVAQLRWIAGECPFRGYRLSPAR